MRSEISKSSESSKISEISKSSKTKYFIIALLFAMIALTSVGVSKWNIHIQHQFNDPFGVAHETTTTNPIIGRYIRIQNGNTSVLPGEADLTYNGAAFTVAVTDDGNDGDTNASTWTQWQAAGLSFTYDYYKTKNYNTSGVLVANGTANTKLTGEPQDAGEYRCVITAVTNDSAQDSAKTAKSKLNICNASDGSKCAAEISFIIKPAEITTATITPYKGTYDGQGHGIIVNAPTITTVNSQVATITYTLNGRTYNDVPTIKDAGEYPLTITITAPNHKTWTQTYTGENAAKIDPKKVTVTWHDFDNLTYNGSAQAPTATVKEGDLVSGDIVNVTVTVNGAHTDANADKGGNPLTGKPAYTAVASDLTGEKARNYTLGTTNPTTTFRIKQLPVTVAWGITTFTYNRSAQAPTANVANHVNNDDVSVTVTVEGEHKNVGTYNATASGLNGAKAENYTLTDATNASTGFTITQLPITVIIEDKSSEYGSIVPLTCTTTNSYANSDGLNNIVQLSTTAKVTSNVGSNYTITGEKKNNDTANNYSVTFENGTYTINPRVVELQWTKTSLIYNGSSQVPTANVTNPANGDTISVTVTATGEHKNVGSYTATATGLVLTGTTTPASNYTLPSTGTTQNFTIEKATIDLSGFTAVWQCSDGGTINPFENNGTVNYEAGTTYTVTIANLSDISLPNGITGVSITDLISVNYNGSNTGTNAGDYHTIANISVKENYAANYKIDGNASYPLSWSITSITEVDVPTNGNTYIYSGSDQYSTILSGFSGYDADIMTVETINCTNAVTYTFTFTLKDTTNYVWSDGKTDAKEVSVIIQQKEITITWSDTSLTYNGTNQSPTATAGDLVSGDSCNITVTGAQKNAGNYKATATGVSNSNYKLPTTDLTTDFTINKANLSVELKVSAINPRAEGLIEHGDELKFEVKVTREGSTTPVAHATPTYTEVNGTTLTTASFSGETAECQQSVLCTITPNDTANYNIYSKSLTFTVSAVAKIGSTYYGTVESALKAASSGNTVYVLVGKNPLIRESCEIKSGVTLCLPLDDSGTWAKTGSNGGATGGKFNEQHAYGKGTLRASAVLANGLTLTNNGKLNIGGQVTGGAGGQNAGFTVTEYSQLTLGKNATLNSPTGSIECYGYIAEESTDNDSQVIMGNGSTSPTITLPFVVIEHRGGSNFSSLYSAGMPVSPFNRFLLPNVTSKLTINYKSQLLGFADLCAGSQHNVTTIKLIGADNNFLINLSSGAKVVSKYATDTKVTNLQILGSANINSLALKVKASFISVDVSTADVEFPISWYFKIQLSKFANGNNATVNSSSQALKILPGSELIIDEGVTVTLPKLIAVQDTSWAEGTSFGASTYEGNGTASPKPGGKLVVNGTLNVKQFNGIISTTGSTGSVIISESVTATHKEVTGDKVYTQLEQNYTANGLMYNASGAISTQNFVTNTTYKARNGAWYIPGTYTLSYNSDGGTAVRDKTYNVGEKLTSNELPQISKEGYLFKGWKYNDTLATEESFFFQNTNLVASWEAASYTVSFDASGVCANPTSQTVVFDSTYDSLPMLNNVDGYTFLGWFTEKVGVTQVTNSTVVKTARNQTLYAHWQYSITLDPNGGTVSPSTIYVVLNDTYANATDQSGNTVGIPAPTNGELTFICWSTDTTADNKVGSGTVVTEYHNTLYAIWTDSAVDITLNYCYQEGENRVLTIKSGLGVTFSYTDYTDVTGYTFMGWYTAESGGTRIDDGTTIITENSPTTLYAHWEIETYTISLNPNGGSVNPTSKSVTYKTAYEIPVPIREGYSFEGWYDSNNELFELTGTTIDFGNTGETVTLTAHWKIETYTIVLDPNGGTITQSEYLVSYGDSNPLLNLSMNLEGHTFVGWYNGDTIFDSNVVGDLGNDGVSITLTAKWTKEKYMLYFDAGDVAVTPQNLEVEYGSTHTLPQPQKDNYVFDGWRIGETPFTGENIGDLGTNGSTIQVLAIWLEKYYLKYEGVEPASGFEVVCGKPYELPKRTGYRLTSLTIELPAPIGVISIPTKADKMPDIGDAGQVIELTAVWAKLITITFNVNGATLEAPPTMEFEQGSQISGLPWGADTSYSKSDTCGTTTYYFQGWFTAASDGTQIRNGTMVDENTPTTLYAHWAEAKVTNPNGCIETNSGNFDNRNMMPIFTSLVAALLGGYMVVNKKKGKKGTRS